MRRGSTRSSRGGCIDCRQRPGRPLAAVRDMRLHLQHGHPSWCMEGWAASGARHGIEYRATPCWTGGCWSWPSACRPSSFGAGAGSRWLMRRARGLLEADKRDS